jgi:single-strand DNA-binding protein
MNTCTISGNITKDPELFSPESSEWRLLTFSIANNDERKKGQDDKWESIVSFFEMKYWTKKPNYWIKQLQKGRYVCCHCSAKQERWDQDGSTRSKITFKVLGFPEGLPKLEKSEPAPTPPEDFEDDIPF